MTYCGVLCEKSDLGFTLEAFLMMEMPKPKISEFPKELASFKDLVLV